MEVNRQKNTSTIIMFPLIDAANTSNYYSAKSWASQTSATLTARGYDAAASAIPTTISLSNTPVHMASGMWYLALTSGDMNYDQIIVKMKSDEIYAQGITIDTELEAQFDSVTPVDGSLTAAKFASNCITSAKLATDCIGSSQVSSAAVTKIQNGLTKTADVIDGTVTRAVLDQRINAWVRGKVVIDDTNSDWEYYAENGSTKLFENRLATTGRTPQ